MPAGLGLAKQYYRTVRRQYDFVIARPEQVRANLEVFLNYTQLGTRSLRKAALDIKLKTVKDDAKSAQGYFISNPCLARNDRICGRDSRPRRPAICSLQLCDFLLPLRVA